MKDETEAKRKDEGERMKDETEAKRKDEGGIKLSSPFRFDLINDAHKDSY